MVSMVNTELTPCVIEMVPSHTKVINMRHEYKQIFSWCSNAFIFKQDSSYRTNPSHCVRSSCDCEMQAASVLEG